MMSKILLNAIAVVTFVAMVTSCDPVYVEDQDYYDFLNKIAKDGTLNTYKDFEIILVEEPLGFYRSYDDLFDFMDSIIVSPANSPYRVSYLSELVGWSINGSLDTLEAKFMYQNQDPALQSLLNKAKLTVRTIPRQDLASFDHRRKLVYMVSYPLYNQNRTKLILTIQTIGSSSTYLFERENEQWILKETHQNWES
jgi:hypothetical protein